MPLLLCVLAFPSFAPAADRPSTDDQLLESLNSKSSDDYDRELMGDGSKPGGKSRVDDQLQKRLQKELGAAAQQEGGAKDPLLQVAEAMRSVQERIGKHDCGRLTQHDQQQIVFDLGKLIDEAKKSGTCGGKSSSGRKPTASGGKRPPGNSAQAGKSSPPAEKSDPNIRKPEPLRPAAAQEARERMIDRFRAELEHRQRERVYELPSEYFLPDYELEIEDYFRRLSEDQPGTGRK